MNAFRTRNTIDSASWPLVRRLVGTYLRPYTRALGTLVLFMVGGAAMTALFARLVQPIMDDVLIRAGTDSTARAMIIPMGIGIFVIFTLRGLASYGQSVQMAKIGQSIISDIQNDLFRHLMRLDLEFFHANPSGQLTSRMISDVNVMRMAVADALTGIGNSALTLIFLIGVMFYQDWVLGLIALSVFPIASAMVAHLGRRLRAVSKTLQDETAILTERLGQIFQGIRQVQAYGMEGAEEKRATLAIDEVSRLNIKSIRLGQMITPINEALVGLAILAIIVYGGLKIADGSASAGSLMSFIAAFSLAYEPMKKLSKLSNVLQMGLGAAERVFALLDLPPKIVDAPQARELRLPAAPTIQLVDLSFRYPQSAVPALDHIDLLFPAGKMTALVGPSGGGKSTILNLLLRFYTPESGQVLINGSSIDEFTLASLRSQIALVSQDITIFNMSVADNIAYGRPNADRAQIEGAAHHAGAHAFIMNLPQGYDTLVGENGVLLSGGQRQRLALARAMLRDAPILLLDEATSALDNESEAVIQQSLNLLGVGRTTIVIAHRLTTVRHADQIVVLDHGRIAEIGTHDDLLDQNGVYARLHGLLLAHQGGAME